MKVPYKLVMIFDGDGQIFPNFLKCQVCNVFTKSSNTSQRWSWFFTHRWKSKFPTSLFQQHQVSYKLILSLLMGMIKHSQSTQINKFAISLQYLKKEVKEGVHFLHLDKHQSFYKLALFLQKWPGMFKVPKTGIW